MPEKPTYEELERRVQELDETETEYRQRIESLRRRENHFRSMVENIPIGLYRTASNGRIIEANPALVKMLGFPDRESLLSVTSAQFYVREEDQREQRRILDRDWELHGFETELRRADGSVLWVRDSARAIRGPDGEVVYAGSLEDITDKKQAEEALEAQRAHLKSLFDHSGEAIVLLDTGNRIIDANSGFVNLFGFSLEEARGKVIEDLICPERFYHTESKELDERSLMGIRGMEIIRRRKDGEEIHVRTSAGPIKVGGSIIGRFLVFDDITPQKQAERALRESEETLRGIFDTMHSGIILVDRDGGIRFANKRMAEMLGYRLDEVIGSGYLDHTHGSESSEATENMHVLIRGEIDSITVERRYQRGDGSTFWGHLSGRRLLHPDGTFRARSG